MRTATASRYRHTIDGHTWTFRDLRDVMAKATPLRSGDVLAGIAAGSAVERMAARMCLAEVPLRRFLEEALVPYETDEVTRLVVDGHDPAAFAPISGLTVGLGMLPRGEVGLIFAGIGAKLLLDGHPVIDPATYAAAVFMVIATTMLTPPLLLWSLRRQ